MAGGAGNRCVFAIQFESRLVVVEFAGFPSFKSMTTLAIGDAIYIKLMVVYIFMASNTSRFHAGKLLIPLG